MEQNEVRNAVYFVLGATGSGKSAAAVRIANTLRERCGYSTVVVVNCDVMQFYVGLPVSTNKISSDEMEGVTHCFMSFLSPEGIKVRDPTLPYEGFDKSSPVLEKISSSAVYNIHSYVSDVVEFVDTTFRNNAPAAVIICGGTCYYAQSLLLENLLTNEDQGEQPCNSEEGQSLLAGEYDEANIWKFLNEIDPDIAVRYHPNDTRRIKRLIEIYSRTNRLPSDIYGSRAKPCFRFCPSTCFVLWTNIEYERLKQKLDERLEKMLERGIIDECRQFIQELGEEAFNVPLANAIGFKEFISCFAVASNRVHLKEGIEIQESIELVRNNTRRYARRQLQWIKNRFLGRLRSIFVSEQVVENLIEVDASQSTSDFLSQVEKATMFFATSRNMPSENLKFPLKEDIMVPEPVRKEWCEICNIFFNGGSEADVHLRSKRHRGALKHEIIRKEQREKYGRLIPPKKRGRS
uniref:Putative tRNA isopentenyltransferase n=1 Tax=Trypanosoma congolense (strain IL3000) TaxID=1068625 RepID=G0UKF6_TRYCI|nr:putative tRNA isopentenyltransferase [Trypanosoma congolense IL3000]